MVNRTKARSYSELIQFDTFEERYRYLKLSGSVGHMTFGYDRYLNQQFYQSQEWRRLRNEIIIRDEACDLGIEDRPLFSDLLIHHMNPVTVDEIVHRDRDILNPEYLIVTSRATHNAIHYGDESLLIPSIVVEREPGDTLLW